MNVITKSVQLPDGRTITIETGKVAKQADGAAVLRMGNTVLLATVCAAKDAVPGTDFMPLQVDYREQYSAAGRFPGGFTKREGKASDEEILTSRLVDRALRYNIKGKEILSGSCKYYMNDLSFKNYLYAGFGYGAGYLLENLVYLELLRHGYDVYVGSIKDKEVDFVAIKNDRTIYVQTTYMLVDEQTIEREYAPLECIADNYEKVVVSLDDLQLPSRKGITHVRAWELSQML